MGLFSSLFGFSSRYSSIEHPLSEVEVRRLISRHHIQTLDNAQVVLIEQAIIQRRHGDGKISLRHIDEVLRVLKNQRKISKFDYTNTMKVMEEYYQSKFAQEQVKGDTNT